MMKKILIALEIGEKERAALRQAAEATGVDCELVFTTPAGATDEQIAEANFILGNVPPKKIAASPNLDVLQLFSAERCSAMRPAPTGRPFPSMLSP